MMRRLVERPGLVFAIVFAWKVALLIFTAQPVPANDSFFYDGAVVNFLLHGKYANPSLAMVLPISGNEVFSAYPPLYQLVLLAWMTLFGTTALAAMWLHVALFGVYELVVLAIFRRLQTPALCVNLAGLFLLAITFHDRPDSLAHVFGIAAVYACVRSMKVTSDGWNVTGNDATSAVAPTTCHLSRVTCRWTWVMVALMVLTVGTSLQIGAFYLLFVWLLVVLGSLFYKEKFPIVAMSASVLIPLGLVAMVAFWLPHLWAGFLEHTGMTPSVTGLRVPQFTSVLKVLRTVPGVLAVSLLLPWLMLKREKREPAGGLRFWPLAGACTATALAVVVASLFLVTANMVAIASYLQPLAVGACLALVVTRSPASGGLSLPRNYLAVILALGFVVSIRAVGMTTWGVVCASDVNYPKALDRLRAELNSTAPGSTVIVSAAYLYETARHDDLHWIHSDWPGKPDYSGGDWERDALVALKPAKLIVTQFDYYRRYEAVLESLEARPELVEIKMENTARIRVPDSIKPMQKVVQHISWAPVVVDFSWR